MRRASSLNALRLIDAGGPAGSPSGVILSRREVASMAERLAKRAHHYASLRVTAFRDRFVFWSVADDVRLPWFDESAVYLTHIDKTIFFPVDKRPDLPAKWIDAITARLTAVKGVSRPVLLWPSRDRRDRDDFGLDRSKIMTAIDSNHLERDASGKPVPTFPHPALTGIGLGRNSWPFPAVDWKGIAEP